MQLRELRRFLAVVEFGSLSKAAAQLKVSQPSLTKDLHALEEKLGFSLFTRTARGVRLTPYGESLLQRAQLIEAEVRRLEGDALALRNVSMGEVHVGVVPGFLQSQVLPQATLNLMRRGRRLSVDYRFGTRASLIRPLLSGALDFAIVGIEEDEFADELVSSPLVLDRHAIVVRSGHPVLAGGENAVRRLAGHPWLVLSECAPLERALCSLLRSSGAPFEHHVVRTDSFHFFRATLAASDCIGLTRLDVTRLDKDAGDIVELPLEETPLNRLLGSHMIGIVHRRNAALSAASQALVREITTLTDQALRAVPGAG
jgi:DNA-binding transcriptional LysR family regulator